MRLKIKPYRRKYDIVEKYCTRVGLRLIDALPLTFQPMLKKQTILLTIFGMSAIAAVFAIVATATILHNRSALVPSEVVSLFYNEWSERASVDIEKPYNERLHERSTYVTPTFGKVVADKHEDGDAITDPVLCLATPPEALAVETISEKEDYAAVAVIEENGGRFARAVLTKDERGWWRIDEIDCA